MRAFRFLAVALLVPSVLAAQAGPQISDSAGVRVVTNAVPGAPNARVSTRPTAEIGVVEGSPAYQLFQVRQATVLRDGTILVLNGGTQEMRFYDKAGKYLRSAGKKGEGPGEFMSISLVGVLPGDTIVLDDGRQKRFSLYTSGGEFVRSVAAPTDLGFTYTAFGLVDDGRILVRGFTIPQPIDVPAVERKSDAILWLSLRDGSLEPFGEFPGTQLFRQKMNSMPLVFGRGLHVTPRGGRIVVANDDTYSLRIYDTTGKVLQVVRERRGPVKARAGEWEEAIPPALRPGAPNYNPNSPFAQSFQAQPHVETKPPFGGFCATSCARLDQAGNMWVEEYKASAFVAGESWHVFDPRGTSIGRLDLPAKASMLDAGAGWILIKVSDELDVEHVRLHTLEWVARR